MPVCLARAHCKLVFAVHAQTHTHASIASSLCSLCALCGLCPPLPPLPLCRLYRLYRSAALKSGLSSAAPLSRSAGLAARLCTAAARTHTHTRPHSELSLPPLPPLPLCRLGPGRSAALPLCRSAEPSRPCRFWHSRWGRFCRPQRLAAPAAPAAPARGAVLLARSRWVSLTAACVLATQVFGPTTAPISSGNRAFSGLILAR